MRNMNRIIKGHLNINSLRNKFESLQEQINGTKSYNSKKSNIRAHLECLNKSLALHLLKYEHFLVLGDFNICVEYGSMSDFCDTYNLKSLIRQPKCYKNPENPSCIDLILTNIPFSFQNLVCLRQVFQIFIG